MRKTLFLLLLCVGVLSQALAQNRRISGKVSSADADSLLPGVSVLVKGSTSGTATDVNGTYSLEVPDNSVLVFSFIGFVSQEVTVGTRTVIDIALKEDVAALEEVVVTGLATSIKRSNLANAVSSGEKRKCRR